MSANLGINSTSVFNPKLITSKFVNKLCSKSFRNSGAFTHTLHSVESSTLAKKKTQINSGTRPEISKKLKKL